MKKNILLATALAITALVSCTDDSFVGDQNLQDANSSVGAISFGMSTPAVTRADHTGSTAATDLSNQFVVYGYKTLSDNTTKQPVFNNYQANYVGYDATHRTTTNSAGWEYVGYTNIPDGITTNVGVTAFSALTGSSEANENGIEQSIKYWDFSAKNYKFYAFSLGTGKTGGSTTYAKTSAMSTSDTYTIEGDQDELSACYISELKTISDPNGSTDKEVELRFLSIKSKLQLGFYETIPGYSVKLLKFYDSSSDDASDATPVLYAGSSTLPKAGTYTVTFDSDGKPLLAWAAAASDGTQANVSFSSTLTNYANKDYKETAEEVYLGRASNEATKTEEKTVLPYANGADLTLKVDYSLLSRDGTGEIIEVKGATATIPAAYTKWKPNYKYTYLFKISDNTNGQVGEVTGLYPITLDAVVASEQDGSQETITTVSEPSITSYALASNVTTDNEYKAGNNIYIVVEDAGTNTVLSSSNAKLYSVTLTNSKSDGDPGYYAQAAQSITEASVANAIVNGLKDNDSAPTSWTVTDAHNWNLIVSTTSVSLSTSISTIPAADSPTGVDLTVNCAKFNTGTYTAATGDKLTASNVYYTDNEGHGKFTANGSESTSGYFSLTGTTMGTFVFEYTDSESKKHYKVIKVVAP